MTHGIRILVSAGLFAKLLFLSILSITIPAFAYPPPLPNSEWDEETKLTLARAMVGEADWHAPDHVAIAYVLAKRWRAHVAKRGPLSFRRYIELYSASLRNSTPRSEWILGLSWGSLPGPYDAHWKRVQKLVQGWGEGLVKDPCPRAIHWGGTMDRPSRSMYPVSCGLTRNIFYGTRSLAPTPPVAQPAKAVDPAP